MKTLKRDFRSLSPFGAEADGLQIPQLDPEDINNLKKTLAERGFVVFREQQANDDDFVSFLKQLGTLTFTAGETPVSHQPALNIVTNVGRKTPPKSVFHTDTSYIAQPPAYTALRMVTSPLAGGETLFVDQYRAYETLPSAIKNQLAQAEVLHVVSGLTLSEDQVGQSWHPLFKRHPISGWVALFLSTPERCQEILGIAPERSQRIIRLLYQHSIRASRIYRHHWQPGDTVVWDNRCTMHRADHSGVVGDRILHRGLVLDEANGLD